MSTRRSLARSAARLGLALGLIGAHAAPARAQADSLPVLHAVRRGDSLVVHFLGDLAGARGLVLERQVGTGWIAVSDTVRALASREEFVAALGPQLVDVMRRFDAESDALLWLRLRTDRSTAGFGALFDGVLARALGRQVVAARLGAVPAPHRVRVLGTPERVVPVAMPRAVERLLAPTILGVSHVPTALSVRFRVPASDAIAWHLEGRNSLDTTWRRLSLRPVARGDASDTVTATLSMPHEGITWQVAVRALGAGGAAGALSPVVRYEAFDRTPPRPVLDPRASLDTLDRVRLRWSASPEPDAAGYHVYRAMKAKERGTRITARAIPVDTLTWTDTARLEARQWIYRLSAIDSAGNESAPGNVAMAYIPDRTPPALTGALGATVLGDSAVRLRWVPARARDLREYIVTRQRGDRTAGDAWTRLTRPLARDTLLLDRGSDAGGLRGVRLLRYRLVALDSIGNASPPLEVEVALPDRVPPAAPVSLRAERAPGHAVISWRASPSADVARYELRRTTGAVDSLIATVGAGERAAWEDFDAGPGARRYTIIARDTAGNPSPSRTATLPVDAGTQLTAPANAIATVRGAGVVIRWDVISGAARYVIERSTTRNGEYVAIGAATAATYTDPAGRTGAWYRIRAVDAAGRDGLRSVAAEASNR